MCVRARVRACLYDMKLNKNAIYYNHSPALITHRFYNIKTNNELLPTAWQK